MHVNEELICVVALLTNAACTKLSEVACHNYQLHSTHCFVCRSVRLLLALSVFPLCCGSSALIYPLTLELTNMRSLHGEVHAGG